eukprot:scaffold2473_cov51-Isochrysis_galbana.AAC.1
MGGALSTLWNQPLRPEPAPRPSTPPPPTVARHPSPALTTTRIKPRSKCGGRGGVTPPHDPWSHPIK